MVLLKSEINCIQQQFLQCEHKKREAGLPQGDLRSIKKKFQWSKSTNMKPGLSKTSLKLVPTKLLAYFYNPGNLNPV